MEGIPFCPVSGFLDAKYLGRLAKHLPGVEIDCSVRMWQREMSSWFTPATLRRRLMLLLARTHWLAAVNFVSLTCALYLRAITIPLEWGTPDRFWQVWISWVPCLGIGWLGGYLLAVMGCLQAGASTYTQARSRCGPGIVVRGTLSHAGDALALNCIRMPFAPRASASLEGGVGSAQTIAARKGLSYPGRLGLAPAVFLGHPIYKCQSSADGGCRNGSGS